MLWGSRIGAAPFNDNSFFTHLATGRLLLEDGFLRSDPYSYAARGEPWVIQSWLVSVLFAGVEHVWDSGAIHLVVICLTAAMGGMVWMLTRPAGSLIPRMGIAALAIGIGTVMWVERPLLVGLVGLSLALLACEGRLDPRWLVPVFWIWANSHGSYPLGLLACGVLYVGARLDQEDAARERKALLAAGIGAALGAIGPLGIDVFLFPLRLLSRSDVLSSIVEWQSPDFSEPWARVFLVQVALAMVALVRVPRWRSALPVILFTSLGLISARNLAVASIVLIPATSPGLRGLGTITGAGRSRAATVVVGVTAVATLVTAAGAVTSEKVVDLGGYPAAALAWRADEGLDESGSRLITEDLAGNLLEGIYGPDADVFIDDRYDMYPDEVIEDYKALVVAGRDWEDILERHEVDTVLWSAGEPIVTALVQSPAWRVVYQDDDWALFVHR